MSHRHEYFRGKAAEAIKNAERSINGTDKTAWLNLANGWLSMLPQTTATAEQQFDARVKADGTGQSENKSSN